MTRSSFEGVILSGLQPANDLARSAEISLFNDPMTR